MAYYRQSARQIAMDHLSSFGQSMDHLSSFGQFNHCPSGAINTIPDACQSARDDSFSARTRRVNSRHRLHVQFSFSNVSISIFAALSIS